MLLSTALREMFSGSRNACLAPFVDKYGYKSCAAGLVAVSLGARAARCCGSGGEALRTGGEVLRTGGEVLRGGGEVLRAGGEVLRTGGRAGRGTPGGIRRFF
jgi:hypothetical protein